MGHHLVAALLVVICSTCFVSATSATANGPGGICIDGKASFDPITITGGCFSGEKHEDAVQVIGFAVIDGQYASGTEIEAHANGIVCGDNSQGRGSPLFNFYVIGAQEQEGCAEAGNEVQFTIDGRMANETLTYSGSDFPRFISLTVMPDHAWYWFERISTPRPQRATVVEALVAGMVCAEATILSEDDISGFIVHEGTRGFSRLVVPHSDVQPGCAQNASLVEFRVNGLRAETAVQWRPGVQRLNLLVQGDANCDFLVDARDALLALQVEAGLLTSVPCHGDADRDHDIDVFDARHILEFAARITNGLPL